MAVSNLLTSLSQNLLAASSAVTVSTLRQPLKSSATSYEMLTTARPDLHDSLDGLTDLADMADMSDMSDDVSVTDKPQDDASLAAEKNKVSEELVFSVVILVLFLAGVVINIACLINLRRHRSTFHRFLKMLASFDLLVVACCVFMYSLPALSRQFHKVSYTLYICF